MALFVRTLPSTDSSKMLIWAHSLGGMLALSLVALGTWYNMICDFSLPLSLSTFYSFVHVICRILSHICHLDMSMCASCFAFGSLYFSFPPFSSSSRKHQSHVLLLACSVIVLMRSLCSLSLSLSPALLLSSLPFPSPSFPSSRVTFIYTIITYFLVWFLSLHRPLSLPLSLDYQPDSFSRAQSRKAAFLAFLFMTSFACSDSNCKYKNVAVNGHSYIKCKYNGEKSAGKEGTLRRALGRRALSLASPAAVALKWWHTLFCFLFSCSAQFGCTFGLPLCQLRHTQPDAVCMHCSD